MYVNQDFMQVHVVTRYLFVVAIEKKLPLLTKVLYPKHNGFKVCLEHFHRSNKKKRTFIHDLTIAYKDHNTGRRTSEVSLMTGLFIKNNGVIKTITMS